MEVKKNFSAKASVLVFSLVLLLALVVNGALGISSFEGIYKDALVARFNIDGEYIKGRIEASLDLGKKIDLLDATVEPLFMQVSQNSSDIDHLYVADSSRKILYTTRRLLNQQYIPFSYTHDKNDELKNNSPYVHKFLDAYFICIPLFSKQNNFEGTLYMEFSANTIASYMANYIAKTLRIGGVLFALAIVIYCACYALFVPVGKNKNKTETFLTIALLLISQLCFALSNYQVYNLAITDVFNANMQKLSQSISESLANPLKHISLDNVSAVNQYLASRISGNEQCAAIYLVDEDMAVLHHAERGANGTVQYTNDHNLIEENLTIKYNDPDITLHSLRDIQGEALHIALKINRPLITSILRDMALDSATIIIVALLFAFMLKNFFMLINKKADLAIKPENMTKEQEATALKLIQISTFIFMFAAYETLSFIPLYIKQVFDFSGGNFFGLTAESAQSVPVSTYMFGMMLAMFITLFGMKNLSVKSRYVAMSLIFIAGSLLNIASNNLIIFSVARLICGFGFGGILLSTSSLVIEYTSTKTRSSGFGINAAAFASASITSIPIGGVIVNKFGYAAGIAVSIVFAGLFLLFALFCIPKKVCAKDCRVKHDNDTVGHNNDNLVQAQSADKTLVHGAYAWVHGVDARAVVPVQNVQQSKNVSAKEFVRALFSRHILTYLLCINIPFQIIYWGLFQFLLPLYMSNTLNLSQGNIGRILSIFSAISLGAVYVSRLADRVKNDKLLISVGALVAGVAMILFGYREGGFLLFILVMIAMGTDNLFVDAIEEVYLESGKIDGICEENILQSYKVIEKVLSVFIPSITSIIIAFAGFNKSIMIIGAYSSLGALAFFVLGKNGRWGKNHGK